jgi:hypothetical protein
MKIKEFVEKYNGFNNDTLKDKFVKEIVKDEYIPYTKKVTICESIVKNTTKRVVSDGKKDKEIFYLDSANRYLLFQMKLIQFYTDLEFSEGVDAIKEFELLDQYGLNDLIIAEIPEREYTNFKVILDMKTDDASVNENNFIQYIDTKLDAVRLVFDEFGDSILNIINSPELLEAIKSAENESKGKVDNIISMK